jgi:hypothetical protein
MRYEVRLTLGGGDSSTYAVTTWHDEAKAVEIAKGRHAYLKPEDVVTGVSSAELGPAPRNPDGTVRTERGDLVDRTEW